MSKFGSIIKQILREATEDYIKVYHGGTRIQNRFDLKVQTPKKGRFEAGVGINTTTHYETAQKYAKGRNIVSVFYLRRNITLASDVNLDIDTLKEFVQLFIGPKNRKKVINDIERILNRSGVVTAENIINLFINYEIGGKTGIALNDFLVENGVDATLQENSNNEDWLIIHNPKIVTNVVATKPKDISLDDYEFPKIKDQLV